MKKLLFLMLTTTIFHLEATHFQSSMSITPKNNEEDEYLVEIQLEKVMDGSPELIVAPKMICTQAEPAILIIESEDKMDLLSIQVMIPKVINQTGVKVNYLIKEKGEVVLSFDNVIKLNDPEY